LPTPHVRAVARRRTRHDARVLRVLVTFVPFVLCLAPVPALAFHVQGLFQFGPAHVGVAFSDSVNAAQALQSANYALTPQAGAPALTIRSVTLQDNQRTVVITTTPLPPGATYDVEVSGVTSRHGDPLDPGGVSFTTVTETVMGIADVHANISALIGLPVTVIGQVFMTGTSSGGTPSGYIQDGTGRGLNLFGNPLQLAADTLGNVVVATGTAALFFTTVELTPFTATLLASRMPHLAPRVLSVAQASSPQWEGTYIRVTASLTGPAVASGANNYSYPASDGVIPFTFRVRNSTGIDPNTYNAGDLVTGAGAGSAFQGTYQATVGIAADFYRGVGPGDITPPVLIGASGTAGEAAATLRFSEPVAAGAATATNYTLFPTAAPGSPIEVTDASTQGSTVRLTLASALAASTPYTVTVANVQDAAGNSVPPGSAFAFAPDPPVTFGVSGVFAFGAKTIGVTFRKDVNASQALALGQYAFMPALALARATLQENGRTVVLEATGALPPATTYELTVGAVTSATGEPLDSHGPFPLTTPSATVVDIATIYADPATWNGQNVTVIGQVTIPVGSRGGTSSGYIQDGSGRGLNVFGGTIQGAVNDRGNVALVTGTVEQYFTTIEITTYTATVLAAGQPPLAPRRVSVAEANADQWEGTYIETSADILLIDASGPTAIGYTLAEGAASVIARVANGLGILSTQFAIGERVTARGVGSNFQGAYQITVGNFEDFFETGAGGPDTLPPALATASGTVGSPLVTLRFSEPLRSNEATRVENYRVFRSGVPDDSIAVAAAALAPDATSVYLTLASPLAADTPYDAQAGGLADLEGNAMTAPNVVAIAVTELPPAGARLEVPARTLVRNLVRQGEVFRLEISGPANTEALCRVFDLQGRLVRVLFDGTLTGEARRTVAWDARDESFEFVPAGLYICHLETTDAAGHVSRDRAPIVVAVRLD
jgi:hypothetical protein